jgi:exopolysaccharide biosynthesis protein
VRDGVVNYTKEWVNWKIDVECVADFVDGSISVSYDDEVSAENTEISEEIVEAE